jgi:hypothetical protein
VCPPASFRLVKFGITRASFCWQRASAWQTSCRLPYLCSFSNWFPTIKFLRLFMSVLGNSKKLNLIIWFSDFDVNAFNRSIGRQQNFLFKKCSGSSGRQAGRGAQPMWLHPRWMREQCRAGRKLVNTRHTEIVACVFWPPNEREKEHAYYINMWTFIFIHTHIWKTVLYSLPLVSQWGFSAVAVYFLFFLSLTLVISYLVNILVVECLTDRWPRLSLALTCQPALPGQTNGLGLVVS